MTLVLLLALLQSPPAQEKTVDERIEAFLKGNEAARVELVKLGALAIRPLLKARERDPATIDWMVRGLKAAAAYPSKVRLADEFDGLKGLVVNYEGCADLSFLARDLHPKGIAFFSDQFDRSYLATGRIKMARGSGPLDLFERLCQQTGLDYGFFHNAVVIGTPERLWRVQGPAKETKLDPAGLALARELVEKLGDESIEVRESATRELMKLGTGVLPLLLAQGNRKEAEIVSCCAAIVRRMRPPGEGVFGPAAALRQRLSAEDLDLLKRLQTSTPSLKFERTAISEIMGNLKKNHGVDFTIAGSLDKHVVTIYTTGQSLFDLLSLVTQSRDLDFLIKDRKVVIDSREAIERELLESK